MRSVVPRRLVRLVAALLAVMAGVLAASVGPARAHDAPMPGGAPHGRLVDEPWVMRHWVPFDEAQLERELGLPDGQLEGFLYNDHHTLAQLATARDVEFEALVGRLAAWADALPAPDRAVIKQRIRLMLVSGHLAQHVLFHVFHGTQLIPSVKRASKLSDARFTDARHRGATARALIQRGGGDAAAVERALSRRLGASAQRGLSQADTPPTEARRLEERQQSQLHCWLRRPPQSLDPAAPYGRAYLLHAPSHASDDTPTTRRAQSAEDREIGRGLAGRPAACWAVPEPFDGDPGQPMSRRKLRALARVPGGFAGPINGPRAGMAHDHGQ